jgi:hypothetical protein
VYGPSGSDPGTQIQRLFAFGDEQDKMAETRTWDTTDAEEAVAPEFTLRFLPQQAGGEKDRK